MPKFQQEKQIFTKEQILINAVVWKLGCERCYVQSLILVLSWLNAFDLEVKYIKNKTQIKSVVASSRLNDLAV
ncbi:hypothetical protein DDR33_00705 [Pararcticibacter amylolyticus]|uniref:Uncharacterized protein n=1 Tax=Pararcticibacter amylolyticus TaxID=2173175 RepID=A0A2U2PMC7_9SPHI|nr:hypothetical protein DDR33_00705 [Pararcticibacter amylolyticus]